MNTKSRIVGILGAGLLLLASQLPAQSPQQYYAASAATIPAVESALLLRNGQVLHGQVSREGANFIVTSPGTRLVVKEGEVESHCRSMEEVYIHRRKRMSLESAQDHLEMAQWCLRYRLLEAAQSELSEAISLDRSHPLIPVVERRLELARMPAEEKERRSQATAATGPPAPTADELDRMVRGLPPKTVEVFAAKIQPMLMSHCATAGCHGQPTEKGLQLYRASATSRPSRRITQRNLYAALQWIDQEDPQASPLLTACTKAHGTARAAVFTGRQMPQYRQLADWCQRVAQSHSDVMPASHNEPSQTGARANEASRADYVEDLPPVRNKRPAAQRRTSMPERQSADACDPEEFNRRYAPPERLAPRRESRREDLSVDEPDNRRPPVGRVYPAPAEK